MLARRGFLAGLIATLAAPAIIRPGLLMPVRRILIPVDYDFKAFVGLITNETLRILEQNLIVADRLNPAFARQFRGIGSPLRIRVPNRFTVSV